MSTPSSNPQQQQQSGRAASHSTGEDSTASNPMQEPSPVAANHDGGDVAVCPICLHDATAATTSPHDENSTTECEFAHGPCGHAFCVPCLERLLTSPTGRNSNDRTTITFGLCPICRAELSLFDLVYLDRNPKKKHVVERSTPLANTPLCGAVYADSSEFGGVGKGSFHFPSQVGPDEEVAAGDDGAKNMIKTRAYYNIERVPRPIRRQDDPPHLYFDSKGSHYHAATRTFSGLVTIDPETNPYWGRNRWARNKRVILSFSHDMRFITRGVIISYSDKFRTQQDFCTDYPLDGQWTVQQFDKEEERYGNPTNSYQLTVDCNVAGELIVEYRREENQVLLRGHDSSFSNLPIVQVAAWNFAAQPTGPSIGSPIEWRDEAGNLRERWVRLTVGTFDSNERVVPIGGQSGRIFKRIDSSSTAMELVRPIPTYQSNSLWGNTFCQAFKVGLASYHFVSTVPDEDKHAYISYEHAETGRWPPLDNGTPIPSRVLFRNIEQPNEQTFRGQICWLQDYGTTWQGMARWDYEMHFDTRFWCIVSGYVKCIHDESEEPQDLSRYGETLVYCNAALFDLFGTDDGSDRSSNEETILQGLRDQGASQRTVHQMDRIWRAAQDPTRANPIDYNTTDE